MFWARGYGTIGNITEDAIKYIAAQKIYAKREDQPKKNFFYKLQVIVLAMPAF